MNLKSCSSISLAAVTVLAFALTSHAITVTNKATADTALFQHNPNNNFGRSWLSAGTINTGDKSRALVQFALGTNIPANAVITNVLVNFRIAQAPSPPAANSTFGLHRVLVPWGEGTKGSPALRNLGSTRSNGEATWGERIAGTANWGVSGGQEGVDYVEQASGTRAVATSAFGFASTPGLIADVQFWLSDSSKNFGWMLITQSEQINKTARRIHSRESAGQEPTLIIGYTVAAGPAAPSIATQPTGKTGYAGGSVTLSVGATGDGTLTYQWLKDGVARSGATSPTLTISNLQTSDAGSYTVEVRNAGGAVLSSAATVTVADQPRIESVAIIGGQAAVTFTAQPNHTFTIEGLSDVAGLQWVSLATLQPVTSSGARTLNVPADLVQRFLRLAAQPVP